MSVDMGEGRSDRGDSLRANGQDSRAVREANLTVTGMGRPEGNRQWDLRVVIPRGSRCQAPGGQLSSQGRGACPGAIFTEVTLPRGEAGGGRHLGRRPEAPGKAHGGWSPHTHTERFPDLKRLVCPALNLWNGLVISHCSVMLVSVL